MDRVPMPPKTPMVAGHEARASVSSSPGMSVGRRVSLDIAEDALARIGSQALEGAVMSHHKGQTRKPCHGCGREGFWRDQGTICHKCRSLMKDGRRYREEAETDKTLGLYKYSLGASHWNEAIGVRSIPSAWHGEGPRKNLEKAFHELVLSVVRTAPSLSSEVRSEADRLLPVYNVQLRERARDYVLCEPNVRGALVDLFLALQNGADAAYANGVKRGRSLLLQVADDELTISEFNERVAKME